MFLSHVLFTKRWFSPELCVGQGVLSVSSDIYAFAMTMLEVSDSV